MSMITVSPSATAPALRRSALQLVALLRRGLNSWIAAAIAYRERQARLSILHRLEARQVDKTRVYRGPLDEAVERAARFRERRRLD